MSKTQEFRYLQSVDMNLIIRKYFGAEHVELSTRIRDETRGYMKKIMTCAGH